MRKYLKQKRFLCSRILWALGRRRGYLDHARGIEGNDLRDMTDELAKAAAKSIVQIQNAFWNHPDKRFEVYLERIELACIKDLKSAKPTGLF